MREELLHFIWRFRYFNHQHLYTESGRSVEILFPGRWNKDQGPDFQHARIRIGDQIFEGPVELHLLTSDWIRHAHDNDAHYLPTILHVVWENDWPANSPLPGGIPVLTLHQRVPKLLLHRYQHWHQRSLFVPCESMLAAASPGPAILSEWQRQLVIRRLQQRTTRIRECLGYNSQDWEETTWIWMARSMGQPVNAEAFEAIAYSLPVRLLARYRSNPAARKALLLGQAGLLQHTASREHPGLPETTSSLQREYCFLKNKHGLKGPSVPVSFLRMRPGNFPSVRLVQLAGLVDTGWFAILRETASAQDLLRRLEGREGPGPDMRRGLVINAFIPLLFAYGCLRDEPGCREKAIRWLGELPAEKNAILSRWRLLGMTPRNAGDSQALLQLKKEYCDTRRCLDCAIGRALVNEPGQGRRCSS